MPKYEFDVYDVMYVGNDTVRIKAKINDVELKERLFNSGAIGVKFPSDRPLWKVVLNIGGKLVLKRKKHNCSKSHYRVMLRQKNVSYSEHPKGKPHPSKWSTLICLKCRHQWRTKAKYVENIPNLSKDDEWQGYGVDEALSLYSLEVEKKWN